MKKVLCMAGRSIYFWQGPRHLHFDECRRPLFTIDPYLTNKRFMSEILRRSWQGLRILGSNLWLCPYPEAVLSMSNGLRKSA